MLWMELLPKGRDDPTGNRSSAVRTLGCIVLVVVFVTVQFFLKLHKPRAFIEGHLAVSAVEAFGVERLPICSARPAKDVLLASIAN